MKTKRKKKPNYPLPKAGVLRLRRGGGHGKTKYSRKRKHKRRGENNE